MCNCKWTEIVLAIVILVFAFLQGISGLNMWIITIAAVVLLIHAFMCKNCGGMCANCAMPKGTTKKSSGKKKR